MTSLRYQPGSHLLLVHDGRACLVAGEADSTVGDRLWEILSSDPAPEGQGPVDDLLDTLVSIYGLRSLPSFALLGRGPDNDIIAVVRGELTALARGVDHRLVASDATPWTSHYLRTDHLALGPVDDDNPYTLPLRSGVVRAAGLFWHDPDTTPTARLEEPTTPAEAPLPHRDPAISDESETSLEAADASGYTALFQRRRPAPPLPLPLPPTPSPVAEVETVPDPLPEADIQQTGSTQVWMGEPTPTPSGPGPEAPLPPPPSLASPTPQSGLIDGIPGFPRSPPSTPPPELDPPPAPIPALVPLVPASVPVLPTAPPPAEAPLPAPRTAPTDGDEQLAATLSRGPGQTGRSVPDVLAARCPAGHWSPAHAPTCRVCGLGIPSQQPVWMTRPRLGRLLLPGGETLDVDRGAVFGRAPHAPSESPERPHLVNISSYGPHLSRMHVEIVLDGWFTLLRDLGSTEGTTLTIPGHQPERLRAGELVALTSGSTVDLAGDYVFVFEAGS